MCILRPDICSTVSFTRSIYLRLVKRLPNETRYTHINSYVILIGLHHASDVSKDPVLVSTLFSSHFNVFS